MIAIVYGIYKKKKKIIIEQIVRSGLSLLALVHGQGPYKLGIFYRFGGSTGIFETQFNILFYFQTYQLLIKNSTFLSLLLTTKIRYYVIDFN